MSQTYICTKCGFRGDAKRITKGTFKIELILWACLLLPGLLYALWRIFSRSWVCRECGGKAVLLDSPSGSFVLKKFPVPPKSKISPNSD